MAEPIYEWDPLKAAASRKHGVDFLEAARVFDDPLAQLKQDRGVRGQLRWRAIGLQRGLAVLVVAHIYPEGDDGEVVRIISARRSTADERRRYDGQNG